MALIVQFTRLLKPDKGERSDVKPVYVNIDNLLYFRESEKFKCTVLYMNGSGDVPRVLHVREADTTVDQKIHERMVEMEGTK